MVRKTRKHHPKKEKEHGVMTIPELRRSFEYIEEYIDKLSRSTMNKNEMITTLQKEWENVFHKSIDRKSAEAYVEHVISSKKQVRKTLRKKRGGAEPIMGAPLDYTTRPGVYIEPAAIPPNAYGNILDYVSKGFWNPEQGHSYDPVPGQTHYPTNVPKGMGENTVSFKGGNRKSRKLRRGGNLNLSQLGATLSQITHVPASVPASNLQNFQQMWYGKEVGPSPDQTQRMPDYQMGSRLPQPFNIKA
jgi:hypothetical protein